MGWWTDVPAGLILVTPSSATAGGTGSSATINPKGSVSFTSCTTLDLDGVFTSTYTNYRIVMSTGFSLGTSILMQYRAGGSTATGNQYNYQAQEANSTTLAGSRTTAVSSIAVGYAYSNTGVILDLYGPNLAEQTVSRSISPSPQITFTLIDYAGVHTLGVAYDGIRFTLNTNAISGRVCVYGWSK